MTGPNEKIHLRYLLDNAPDAIIIINRDGKIIQSNKTAIELLGYSESELHGMPFTNLNGLLPEFSEIRKHLKKNEGNNPLTYSLNQLKKDKSEFQAEFRLSPYNKEYLSLVFIRDITKQYYKTSKIKQTLFDSRVKQRQISSLLKASRHIPLTKSFNEAAKYIFGICKDLIGAQKGFITLLDEDHENDEILYMDFGTSHRTVTSSLSIPLRGIRKIAYEQHKVIYENSFEEKEWKNFLPGDHIKINNALIAPLIANNNPVGVIALANKETDFTEADAEMAKSFSDLAAIAFNYVNYKEELRITQLHYTDFVNSSKEAIGYWKIPKEFDCNLPTNNQINLLFKSICIESNKALWELLGLKRREDIIGKKYSDIQQINTREPFELFLKNNYLLEDYVYHLQLPNGTDSYTLENWHGITTNGRLTSVWSSSKDITGQKRIEFALLESEEKYRSFFETAKDGAFLSSLEGKLIDCNKGFVKLFGYESKQSIMNTRFSELYVDIDDREKFLQRLKQDSLNPHIAIQFRKKDGNVFRGIISGVFLNNSHGDPIGVQGTITDISAQEDAALQLKRSEEKYKKLFVNMTNCFALNKIVCDENNKPIDYITLEINPAFERVVGIKRDEILYKSIKNVLPTIEDEWITLVGRVALTGNPESIEVKSRPLNRFLSLSVTSPQKGYFAVFFDDISQRKNAELDLIKAKELAEENEKRLNEAQELAKIGSWELNFKQETFHWSDEMYNIFNCKKTEVEPSYEVYLSFVHPEDKDLVDETIQNHLKDKEPYDITHKLLTCDNKIKYVNEKCHSIFDKQGNIILSKGTIADITEQVCYQQELLRAKEKAEESDRLKTEFLNNLSHEIRTPMNGIIGFSDFLNKPDLDNNKRNYYIRIIQNSSKQLLRTIDDILEISTLSTQKVQLNTETFCLNDLLMELHSIFNLRAQVRSIPIYLMKGLSERQSRVRTDKTKLTKIISNLIDNSLRYTVSGYIEVGYTLIKDNLELYVKDTGIGIDPTNHKKIFERFSQEEKELSKKTGGLGLGLSIAQENARLINGNIRVDSSKGNGATFFVTIPYTPATASVSEDLNYIDKTTAKTPELTILIAEDEEVNYFYIEALCKEINDIDINLVHAINGRQAVDICLKNQDIDLVLMDIKMPLMNGIEATKKVKAVLPDLPVIAQTAYSSPENQKEALLAGCDSFISKPINKETLFRLIRNIHQQFAKKD